jgi:hypothetical protein
MLGENIILLPLSVVIFTIRQTQLFGSRVSGFLYDTATCFGCLYQPSSGRALVHRKVKRERPVLTDSKCKVSM